MVTPRDIAYMEFEALFGGAYASRLDEAGKLGDGVTDADALYWSALESRAVVFVPGVQGPVVVDHLEELGWDDQTRHHTVRYLGVAYDIPEETAWCLDRLYELREEGFELMPWARARDPDLVAYVATRDLHGVAFALRMAILRESATCPEDYEAFWWDEATDDLEVNLPALSAIVPVHELGEVWFDEDTDTMSVHYLPLDEWIEVPEETRHGLDYLLWLRGAEEELNDHYRAPIRAASPAGVAVPPQPPPRSPGRASTNRSVSPSAATSNSDYSKTASAAAGAPTMHADVPMVDPDTLSNESESPPTTRAVVEPMDDDDFKDELMSVDDTDLPDLEWT